MQKETDFVRKAYVHERRSSAFTDGWEKSTLSQHRGGLLPKSGLFLNLEPGHIITTCGVRGRHSGLADPGKMGISPPLAKRCHHLRCACC